MDYLGQDHLTGVLYGLVNLSLALISEAFGKLGSKRFRGLGIERGSFVHGASWVSPRAWTLIAAPELRIVCATASAARSTSLLQQVATAAPIFPFSLMWAWQRYTL